MKTMKAPEKDSAQGSAAKGGDRMHSSVPRCAKLRALCEKVAAPFAQHLLTSDDIYATFFKCRAFGKSGGSKSQRVEV